MFSAVKLTFLVPAGTLMSSLAWVVLPPQVRAVSLSRSFGQVRALENLSLEVHAGELFGFLGPNGAGKTTALRLLAGLLTPSAGEAFIAGHSMTREPVAAKQSVGFVPDTPFLYDKLTGREFLAFMAGLFGVPKKEAAGRVAALLRLLELEGVVLKARCKTRQRLLA